MAVFRVERNKGYTVMSNHHLRNKELTLKAKGLLSQMLSLPEDQTVFTGGAFQCPIHNRQLLHVPCGSRHGKQRTCATGAARPLFIQTGRKPVTTHNHKRRILLWHRK